MNNVPTQHRADSSRRLFALIAGGLLALAYVALSPGGGAAASPRTPAATPTTCDQAYGCQTTTTEASPPPTCGLSSTSVNAGDTVTATVTNVPVGERIDITFAGQVVASATSTADGNGQQALGAIPRAGHLRA